jgi:hypothetical protein
MKARTEEFSGLWTSIFDARSISDVGEQERGESLKLQKWKVVSNL